MTIKEASRFSGVSVRTLQHYDNIGLLCPAVRTEAGYRIYEEADLLRLQDILLLKELEFSLKDIKEILDNPAYDRKQAIGDQIQLLELKRQRLDAILSLARGIQTMEDTHMDFKAFDKEKQEALAKEAKEKWGGTDAYQEYAEKARGRSQKETDAKGQGLMLLLADFGKRKDQAADSEAVQAMVKKLQGYITQHFYTCTPQILAGLGQMYMADERFRANIDAAGGEGTAQFVSEAIKAYCK